MYTWFENYKNLKDSNFGLGNLEKNTTNSNDSTKNIK